VSLAVRSRGSREDDVAKGVVVRRKKKLRDWESIRPWEIPRSRAREVGVTAPGADGAVTVVGRLPTGESDPLLDPAAQAPGVLCRLGVQPPATPDPPPPPSPAPPTL